MMQRCRSPELLFLVFTKNFTEHTGANAIHQLAEDGGINTNISGQVFMWDQL